MNRKKNIDEMFDSLDRLIPKIHTNRDLYWEYCRDLLYISVDYKVEDKELEKKIRRYETCMEGTTGYDSYLICKIVKPIINLCLDKKKKEEKFNIFVDIIFCNLETEKETIVNFCKRLCDGKNLDKCTYQLLYSCFDFILEVKKDDFAYDISNQKEELRPFYALILSEMSLKKEYYAVTEKYIRFGLFVTDYRLNQNAFNLYGFYALNTYQLQLSYDVYQSWLQKKIMGELEKELGSLLNENSIILWEDQKNNEDKLLEKKLTALMYNNMAYVIGKIADFAKDEERIELLEHAIHNIDKAIVLDKIPSYWSMKAHFCRKKNESKEALNALREYQSNTEDQSEKVDVVSEYIQVILQDILNSYMDIYEKTDDEKGIQDKIRELLRNREKDFRELEKEYHKYEKEVKKNLLNNLKEDDFSSDRRRMYIIGKILTMFDNAEMYEDSNIIKILLLLIEETAKRIKDSLRRYSYSSMTYNIQMGQEEKKVETKNTPIIYYTTLNTVKYLFDELYMGEDNAYPERLDDYNRLHSNEQIEKGLNCLTVMHAKYMNDPNEGLILFQELDKEINKGSYKNILFQTISPENFRDNIYNRNFIFLKSFTSIKDKLNMWSMYASDRESGTDSNGCCVFVNSKTFEYALKEHKGKQRLENSNDENDYYLYEIAYVEKNGELKANDNVKKYYSILKKLVSEVNLILALGKDNMQENKKIWEILQDILSFLAFLFKDASYRLEEESRLIIMKSENQMEQIKYTSQNPAKLYVNPYFQVYVDEIMLGPKVKQPDTWMPYFQYELLKMRKKDYAVFQKTSEKNSGVIVTKSMISYRD